MPRFRYTATNEKGKTVRGLLEAPSEEALYAKLRNDGLYMTDAQEAQKALVRLYGALKGREAAEGEVDWSEKYAAQFKAAMDYDFNTPLAIAAMFELATEINRTGDPVLVRQLKGLGAVLNILQLDPENFLKGGASDADEARINALIEERREAKKAKNFARADEIRKSLLDEGIVLMDGPQGTTWRRI